MSNKNEAGKDYTLEELFSLPGIKIQLPKNLLSNFGWPDFDLKRSESLLEHMFQKELEDELERIF